MLNGSNETAQIIFNELKTVEVKNFSGKKENFVIENLGSVNDFRENSIKRPQYVDLETYKLEVSGLIENPKNYTYDQILNKIPYDYLNNEPTLECYHSESLSNTPLIRSFLHIVFYESHEKTFRNSMVLKIFD